MKSVFVRTGIVTLAALSGVALLSASPRIAAEIAREEKSAEAGAAPALPACGPGPVYASQLDASGPFLRARPQKGSTESHEFYFVRAIYNADNRRGGGFGFGFGGRGGYDQLGDGGPNWSIDYPNDDRHVMLVAKRLSNLDVCPWEHPVSLADPELRRFPFLYTEEWGRADLTDDEVQGLRNYLAAGGFLVFDDFWGSREWANFEHEMTRVLPGRPIVDVPRDNLLFHSHYTIEGPILQVPNAGYGRAIGMGDPNAQTSEQDGYVPHVKGIFDDRGRLMVVINWNTDLGDAMEWAEDPYYPLKYSTFAAELFMNIIIYGMTQ